MRYVLRQSYTWIKHGKHDQRSHGRSTGRRMASRGAYSSARAGGASVEEARAVARDVSEVYRSKQRIDTITARLKGDMSDGKRRSLEAEHARLTQEIATRSARTPAAGKVDHTADKPRSADGPLTKAYGANPNESYTMQHRIVDMADIQASNTASGAINPLYDSSLQPRDRSRAASQQQIDAVARNMNPDVLVTDFHRIDSGSPIIDAHGNVLSGNGRTLALQRAAELHPEQYAAYRARMREEAIAMGVDPKVVDGMRNPVMVRELKGDVNTAAFAREANSSGTLRMSPLEQAKVDAHVLSESSMLRLHVGEGQDIDRALRDRSNKPFIDDFMKTVPENERANLMTRDGSLNQQGLYRIKAAVYTKVFSGEHGERMAESMLESLDPDVKTIQNGISAALPNMSRATALLRSGQRDKSLDISEDMAKVVDVYARVKDNPHLNANTPANKVIAKYLDQTSMFDRELSPLQERMLVHVDSISRRPTAVRDFLNRYARIIEDQPPPGQASLFGDVSKMSKHDLITLLISETGGAYPVQTTQQPGMFA